MNKRIKSLYLKYLNDTCTREEFDEVFDYLSANPEDRDLERMLDKQYNTEVRPTRRRSLMMYAAAAILVFVSSGIAWTFINKSPVTSSVEAASDKKLVSTTNKSEWKYVVLPDNSQVWLNAASSIQVSENFGKRKREVYLTGEAYFDVKHADDMPFIIHSGKVSTEVLGTAFNIKAYPDMERVTVSVKRGSVKVNYSTREIATLTKGEQVSIGTMTSEIKRKAVKEEETAAWQDGNLIYDDYSVGDIVKDLEKIFNTSIHVNDATIRSMTISTKFKKDAGIQQALEILCRLTDAELMNDSGTYIIKSNNKEE